MSVRRTTGPIASKIGAIQRADRTAGTLGVLTKLVEGKRRIGGQSPRTLNRAGVFNPPPKRFPRNGPKAGVPHPSDGPRVEGFQRALQKNRLRTPRRSVPRPPY